MIRRTMRLRGVAALAAAGLLWGCGSSSKPPTAGVAGASAPAVTVTMGYHSFNPDTVTILVGQTVDWHNDTWISHTVTCDPSKAKTAGDAVLPAGATPFDSGEVARHTDYQYTFTVPGEYHYFCIPHESHGMLGKVIVQGPSTMP